MSKDLETQIKNLRERARSSEDITDDESELLITFSDRLDLHAQEYSDYRHKKLLGTCVRIAERTGGLDEALYSRDAAEGIVTWINRTWDNEETNRDYRSAVRVFGRRVAETIDAIETDTKGVPESVAWITTSTSSDYDPTPDPREMLHWDEHVIPMTEASYNARDAAMVALQFDAGLRGGEFKDLSVGDIQDHKHGLQVTVEGKQGRRTVTLIPGATYVNDWLKHHPADRLATDAPLWSKLHSVDTISDKMISKALDALADRAGVLRPVTLTNFRKSSAAFLASRNLNQAHIEDHHGWVRGSRAAARYIAVFGKDTDRELARVHGIDIPEADEPDRIAPVPCPRCGDDVPRHEPVCGACGQAMNPQAAQELVQVEQAGSESLADLPPGEQAQMMVEVFQRMGGDPEVMRRAVDLRD